MSVARQIHYMTRDDVTRGFTDRGWIKGAGGHLYYNGLRTTDHPHLHLIIDGYHTVLVNRDVRLAIKMLAWSDGLQGQGGGGWTYIRDGQVYDQNWARNAPQVNRAAVIAEFNWIMDYFTAG